MTDIDLDELERLAKAATPGPWETYPLPGWEGIAHEVAGHKGQYLFDIHKARNGKANAAYIVAACNALPRLIAIARYLAGRCIEMDAELRNEDLMTVEEWLEVAKLNAKEAGE